MASKTMLGCQLKRLLSNLSDRGTRHLSEVETDLEQTSFLLNGAIGKLGASFSAMHAAVAAQQEAVDALLAGATPTSEMVESLKAGRAEIDRHVNAAVTGLQFHDMTSQLIGRTVRRIDGLRNVLGHIGASGTDMPADNDTKELVAALDRINSVLEQQSRELENALWKAVNQTHMESGDVELF
jgi:molecular chaperone DnaK (HSP70)